MSNKVLEFGHPAQKVSGVNVVTMQTVWADGTSSYDLFRQEGVYDLHPLPNGDLDESYDHLPTVTEIRKALKAEVASQATEDDEANDTDEIIEYEYDDDDVVSEDEDEAPPQEMTQLVFFDGSEVEPEASMVI